MQKNFHYTAALLLALLPPPATAQVTDENNTNTAAEVTDVRVAEVSAEKADNGGSVAAEAGSSDLNVTEEITQLSQEDAADMPATDTGAEAIDIPDAAAASDAVSDKGIVEALPEVPAETAEEVTGLSVETEEAVPPASVAATKSGSVSELFDSIEVEEDVAPVMTKKASKPESTVTKSTGGSKFIVVGTYSTKENADTQLERVVSSFEHQPEIIQKQREHGFGYSSKSSGRYFIATIGPFASNDVLSSVLAETRTLFPDAYVLRVNGKTAGTTEKKPVVKTAQIKEKTEKTAREMTPKADAAEEKRAAAEQKPALIEEQAPEQTGIETAEETEVAVLSEGNVAAFADVEVEEEAGGASPRAESSLSTKSMLMGTAALFGVLFLALFFVARRKPKGTGKTAVKTEEAVAPEEQAEVVSAAKTAAVEAVSSETAIREETAAVKQAPAVEEKIEIPTVKPAETVVPTVAAAARSRKKREARSDRGKITKEDFAEFRGARILVAEDNLINQKVILGLLGESGMEVAIANDGQEALDLLKADSGYQLVLMDAHMPRIDGFEATRQIRANPGYDHITVVALSGDTSSDDIRKMREAGMEEQLEKPLKMDALYDALYCYLDVPAEGTEVQAEEGAGLDREAGLESTGGDEELYNEVLSEFASMYGKSDAALRAMFSTRELAQAQALLLDIKSLAANIGATTLADRAEELREAIVNGEEERFGALLGTYQTELNAVIDAI